RATEEPIAPRPLPSRTRSRDASAAGRWCRVAVRRQRRPASVEEGAARRAVVEVEFCPFGFERPLSDPQHVGLPSTLVPTTAGPLPRLQPGGAGMAPASRAPYSSTVVGELVPQSGSIFAIRPVHPVW